jgi:phosphatidylinositol alpha-mannosyltransferase
VRVAVVCPYDLSVPGGVQAQVSGLAEALQRAGTSVTVVSPASATIDGGRAQFSLIGIGRSLSIAANGSRAPVSPGPLAMTRTLRALKRIHPDVVHVHEPLVPGASLAALLAGPRPIVATFHRAGCDAVYRAEGALLRPFARRLDATVAVSEAARATARQVLGRHLGATELIPNGIDTALFPHRRNPDANGLGGAPVSPLRVVFVGRHEERKGLAVLLEAFELLQRRGGGAPASRLLVVGEGPETKSLRQRFAAGDGIEWLGAVDDVAKARLLGSADVFVAPSLRGESFGVILLEAMAAGAAVIASDLPGYRLAAAEAARFVKPGDASALAEALALVLGDAGERQRLAVLAGERVGGFSMDAVAERYLQLYARVASRRP